MTCAMPPEIDDAQLSAYLDGDDLPEVAAHLQGCPYCRNRLERYDRLQTGLTKRLHRATCPTPLELGEYHLGLAAPEQAAALARHIAECPACRRDEAQLRGYLADLAPELELSPAERVRAGIRVVIARLLGGSGGALGLQPALAPASVGLRGAEEAPAIYDADGVRIILETQADFTQPGRWALLGLTIGLADPAQAVVHLWRDAGHVAAVGPDAMGNFVISDLPSGPYELILSASEVEIHIQELTIGL
jgi:hypothetical protein